MATIKSFTDLTQSKVLAEFLPLESADMGWNKFVDKTTRILPIDDWDLVKNGSGNVKFYHAWSLAALLSLIKDKCGYFELVYLKRTSDGRANPLEDVYRLSTDVYDVYEKEEVDACVEMILKLNELKLL